MTWIILQGITTWTFRLSGHYGWKERQIKKNYHNHRRYNDGKRKDRTPLEILTGRKQKKDWIGLLFDVVKEKDPYFFAYIKNAGLSLRF